MNQRFPVLLYVAATLASACSAALAQDAAPVPGSTMTVAAAAQAMVVMAAGVTVLWQVYDKATGGARNRREQLERHERLLYGERGATGGLVARVEALEGQGQALHEIRDLLWRDRADEEPTTVADAPNHSS